MHIESSAPTRIDLAGGTLDIWPLYLYHESAQTLNVAISLRARCTLTPRADHRLAIVSEDTGQRIEGDHCASLPFGELPLLVRLLRQFEVTGIDLVTRCESPLGAGIAGSSALNVAACGALAAWSGRHIEPEQLLRVAMNVEAQAISVPTGAQDYQPAYYGGIAAVELRVDGIRRVALPVDPADLERRLVLAYTGASRTSGINNWEITKRHIDGDRAVYARFEEIRDVARAMRDALVRGDWDEVGRQVAVEWESRKRLAPDVTTSTIDRLLEAARRAGAVAGKVCGAGGGGCLFCLAPPDALPGVRNALVAGGARLLDWHVDMSGLSVRVHRSPAASSP